MGHRLLLTVHSSFLLMQTPTSGVHDVVDTTNKFTQTGEVCGEKGRHGHSLNGRVPILTLAWTGFYCFSGSITSRKVLIHYAQVCFR